MNKLKKRKILIILVLFLFLTTGCTKTLTDKNNKRVVYEKTGQSITENILCKPTNKEVIDIYKKNDVDISKLPECKEFKITSGGYEGLWTSIFVKPLAWLIITIGKLLKNYGFGLIIVSILIRAVLIPITKKTAMQSENMKKAQPELNKIERKYQNKPQDDRDVMMQKSQEMMMVYKKYNINPMSGCLFSFIQIPLFFAFLEAVNRVPALFEETFIGFHLGTTPIVALSKGTYIYIILIIATIATTYFSFKLNATAVAPEQEQQMKFMTRFMMIIIAIASFSLPAGIAIYWIATNLFTVVQNLIVKKQSESRK